MTMLPVIGSIIALGAAVGFLMGAVRILFQWPFYHKRRGSTRPSSIVPTYSASMEEALQASRTGTAEAPGEPGGEDCTALNASPTTDCLEIVAKPR